MRLHRVVTVTNKNEAPYGNGESYQGDKQIMVLKMTNTGCTELGVDQVQSCYSSSVVLTLIDNY